MLKAKDIMTTGVATVSPETTIEDLGRLLIEKGISGVPVIDAAGRLVGIVTENDLIRQNARLHIPTVVRLFDAFIPIGGSGRVEEEIRRMSATTVSEICTKKVLTVQADASLEEIATVMSDNNVHLLPVLDQGKLAGIIGKMDVIKGTFRDRDQQKP